MLDVLLECQHASSAWQFPRCCSSAVHSFWGMFFAKAIWSVSCLKIVIELVVTFVLQVVLMLWCILVCQAPETDRKGTCLCLMIDQLREALLRRASPLWLGILIGSPHSNIEG